MGFAINFLDPFPSGGNGLLCLPEFDIFDGLITGNVADVLCGFVWSIEKTFDRVADGDQGLPHKVTCHNQHDNEFDYIGRDDDVYDG